MSLVKFPARLLRSAAITALFGSYFVVAGGCHQPLPEDRAAEASTEPTVELIEVPWPDLEILEPQVARALQTQRDRVERLRAERASGRITNSQVGDAYGELCRHFHAYEIYEAAETCYRNARSLQPERLLWRDLLGRLYLTLGQPAEAAEEIRSYLDQRPNDHAARLVLGRALAESGLLDAAREAFASVIEAMPGDAVAAFELGQVDLEAGNYDAAAEQFERALELQPTATRIHLPLATAYRQLGRSADAERHLALHGDQPLRGNDPVMRELSQLTTGVRVHLDRGVAAFERRDFVTAVNEFTRAVKLDPDDPQARQNLASALFLGGRPDAAEEQYREALRLDPDRARTHFNLGTLLGGTGRKSEAIDALREAIRLEPNYRDAHFNLATQFLDTERWDEARQSFERVLELDPGNGVAYLGVGRGLAGTGRWAEALERLEAGRQALPAQLGIQLSIARLLAAAPDAKVRDGERALRLADSLVSRHRTVQHLEVRAMALAEVGRFDEAVSEQQAAIELAATNSRQPGGAPPHLVDRLADYRAGEACREPWPGIGRS